MIIFLQLLLFARYLTLTTLNQRKVLFVLQQTKQLEGPISMKWNWRLLKLSGNMWISLIVAVIVYTLVSGILIGADYISPSASYAVYTTMVVLIALFLLLFMIIDIGYTLFRHRDKRCNPFMLWKEDTLYFRFEIYIIGLCITFPTFLWLGQF
jgi:hypothetical protein